MFFVVWIDVDCCVCVQFVVFVFVCVWVFGLFCDVFDGYQVVQFECVVDDQYVFEVVVVYQCFCFGEWCVFFDCDEVFVWCYD